MKYLKQIQDLESEIHYKNISQLTIDLVQNTQMDLNREEGDEIITRDHLGFICYRLGCILEIFDPAKKLDIEIIQRLHDIVEEWMNDIEFVNMTLGLPLEGG